MPLKMTDGAQQLLKMADAFPIRQPERARLTKALTMLHSSEWDRLVVELTPDDLAKMPREQENVIQDCSDLELIIGVSETIVQVYGFETLDVPHIAVALAATTTLSEEVIDTVSRVFGLGHLEDISEICNNYLRLESNGDLESSDPPISAPDIDLSTPPSAEWAQRFAPWINLLLRFGSGTALCWVAFNSGIPVLALVGVAALISSYDPRGTWSDQNERKLEYREGWLELPLRWPWLAAIGIVATVTLGPLAAWIVLLQYLSIEGTRIIFLHLWCKRVVATSEFLSDLGPVGGKILTLPDSLITHRRIGRFLVSIAVLAFFLPFGPGSAPLMFFIFLIAMSNRPVLIAVAAAAGLMIDQQPVLVLTAMCLGVLIQFVIRQLVQIPAAPVAWSYRLVTQPSSLVRIQKARKLIRNGLPQGAVGILVSTKTKAVAAELLLLAWAWLDSNEPGQAKKHLTESGLEGTDIGRLVAFRIAIALQPNTETSLVNSLPEFSNATKSVQWWGAFHTAQYITSATSPVELEITTELLNRAISTYNPVFTAIYLRLAAESYLDRSPWGAALLATVCHQIISLNLPLGNDSATVARGSARVLWSENFRSLNVVFESWNRISADAGSIWMIAPKRLESARWLAGFGQPLEAARVMNQVANHNEDHVLYRATALDARLETISILNSARHRFEDPLDRNLWWKELGATFAAAMRQTAKGKDWRTLAELIESARLQLDEDDATAVAKVPPFVSVRGKSALAETSWYDPTMTPPIYSLEDGAAWVGGVEACWWSSWEVDGFLYWAFVPQQGLVHGGVIELDAEGITSALADLRRHLPFSIPGEEEFDFELRMFESPLVSGPYEVEQAFTARFSPLLPSVVCKALQSPKPPTLVLAPAAALASVLWPTLILPDQPGIVRLVERTELVLAPPLSLIAAVSRRPEVFTDLPIRLAVVNPGDDLPGAERLNAELHHATVDNPAPGTWTTLELSNRLQKTPYQSTAIFACHTDRQDHSPTSLGLLLSPLRNQEDPKLECVPRELVSARDLIQRSTEFPMPAQVVLLACDSAALGGAQAGEWLVLGPATLMAGAQRAIVTTHPVVDEGSLDLELVSHISRAQNTLGSTLATLQRAQIKRWRDGYSDAAPVHWAGHTIIGGTARSSLPLIPHSHSTPVDESLAKLVDEAAGIAERRRHSQIEWWDVANVLMLGGWIRDNRNTSLLGLAILAFRARPWRRRLQEIRISTDVLDLLQRTHKVAMAARHQSIAVNHLVVAFLQTPGIKGAILRHLMGVDTRNPEVTKTLLSEEEESGYKFTGLPNFQTLDTNSIETMYGAFGSPVPTEQERWFCRPWSR